MHSKCTQVNVKQCLEQNTTFRHTPPPFHPAYSYRVLYVKKVEHGSLLGEQRQGGLEFKVTLAI